MLYYAVFCIFLLIFCFSLLKYTYHHNYRSHISLQVAKLAKSAGVQILIFPTVYTHSCNRKYSTLSPQKTLVSYLSFNITHIHSHTDTHTHTQTHTHPHTHTHTHNNHHRR